MLFQAAIAPESTEEITSITDGLGLCYLSLDLNVTIPVELRKYNIVTEIKNES